MTDKSGTVQIGFDLDGLPSPHKALLVAAATSDGACGEKDASKVEAHATTGGGARVQAAVGGAAGIQGLTKELFPNDPTAKQAEIHGHHVVIISNASTPFRILHNDASVTMMTAVFIVVVVVVRVAHLRSF